MKKLPILLLTAFIAISLSSNLAFAQNAMEDDDMITDVETAGLEGGGQEGIAATEDMNIKEIQEETAKVEYTDATKGDEPDVK